MSNYTHIRIEVILQPVDSDFNANMQEAERQKKLAEAAPALLKALEACQSAMFPSCSDADWQEAATLSKAAFREAEVAP